MMQHGIAWFAENLTAKFSETRRERFEYLGAVEVQVRPGRSYDKLVLVENGQDHSVHAFVRKADQALIKAASWEKPQRNSRGEDAVRFSLADEASTAEALEAADESGSYLYAR